MALTGTSSWLQVKPNLELNLQSKLDGPRLVRLGPESAERRRYAEVSACSTKDYSIKRIDEVRSEVYGYSLVNRSSFHD